MYCVYLITYTGDKLPKYYVGSTKVLNLEQGYRGSVYSKKYKSIWKAEVSNNPQLFTYSIISKHKTRQEALEAELQYQVENSVVCSECYANMSLAQPDGFFGMDVSGKNNPMHGKSRKGERHKGGHNISKGLKHKYESGEMDHVKAAASQRMKDNNPSQNPEVMGNMKESWSLMGRGIGDKNGMYGKDSAIKGKKLYNNGAVTKAYIEGTQPEGWVLGRHPR